jgi:Fanconi anemia group M protein
LIKNYFSHPLLRDNTINYRQYQQDIVTKLLYKNSLVVIPTSLGKTIIALLACVDILFNWRHSKVLILAPTRPLVIQHFNMFRNHTVLSEQCIALTGNVSPEIRKTIWRSRSIRIFFATPELVNNDLRNNLIRKEDFYLIVFDEAQRTVKDYSYTHIAKQFYDANTNDEPPLILGLSASPGSTEEKVREICSNLFIEQIIAKTEGDTDVLPYIYNTSIEYCPIKMTDPDIEISELLKSMISDYVGWLIKNKFLKKKRIENVYKKDLLELRESIISRLDSKNPNFLLIAGLKYQSISMILYYCRDLIESQGDFALRKFINSSKLNDSKTYAEFFADSRIKKITQILDVNIKKSSPKLEKLLSIVTELGLSEKSGELALTSNSETVFVQKNLGLEFANGNSIEKHTFKPIEKKILIFSQYRDTLEEITVFLTMHNISCKGFFGQSKKHGQKGLNQDKQLSILEDFRNGKFQVLVATSVAEEGLNIPNVDLVIFYEPVPSEIRFIQRKGRTGRFSNGRVIILSYENSIDIKYLESSKRKLSKMKTLLQNANYSLATFDKRDFGQSDRISESELYDIRKRNSRKLQLTTESMDEGTHISANVSNNPVIESITSSSNRNIKHLLKKLSYEYTRVTSSNDKGANFTSENLEDLFEVSLNLDRKKITSRIQRQIMELLSQAGRSGLKVSQLDEIIVKDKSIVVDAINNLKKSKRITVSEDDIITPIESKKFLSGNKYSVFVEKIMTGKALVRVNEKWYALLEHHDYYGPRALLKKGNTITIVGELYRKSGKLHLLVKKTL